MASSNLPDYKKFTITSKRDPSTKTYDIPDYDKDIRAFIRSLESALPAGAFYHVGEKQLKKSGQMSVDIYVHQEDASLVNRSLKREAGKLGYRAVAKRYIDEGTRQHVQEIEEAPQREAEAKQKEKEEKEKQKQEKAEAKAEDKERRETVGHIKSFFFKAIGILTLLTDITRRILSAVLDFATQSQKDMIQAHNLGMSYETVRAFRNTEIAHGMREGILTEGVADVQTKFGNITKLDEGAIEDLAVVMGNKVEEMVKVAQGEQNPDKRTDNKVL